MATAIHRIADSPCMGRPLIDFCVSRLLFEALRDVPAMSPAVFTSSLRMTVRPIGNHPSHGDTTCSDAPLCAPTPRESYNSHGGPPHPFRVRLRRIVSDPQRRALLKGPSRMVSRFQLIADRVAGKADIW